MDEEKKTANENGNDNGIATNKAVGNNVASAGVTLKQEPTSTKNDMKTEGLILGKPSKAWIWFLVFGILFLGGGAVCLVLFFVIPDVLPDEVLYPALPSKSDENLVYSDLTGEVLTDASLKTAPTFCIQTPNGMDGARPQAGINQAGVIFEAIAEAGITRFAAIYQNPTAGMIGPIRSLRLYYLEWDTPFDCTIVHAGGADDAIAAVRAGGYRDLTENYTYMYRGTSGSRRWNNLFTTSENLKQFNDAWGYTSSEVKGFDRMTVAESEHARIDSLAVNKLEITTPSLSSTSELVAKVSEIHFRFGGSDSFNVDYRYDLASNKYLRSYANGDEHQIYNCDGVDPASVNPEGACELQVLSPSVVVALIVGERKGEDGYHEDITTIGSNEAYVFQNGEVIHGIWKKDSAEAQIEFYDDSGAKVALAPGQTMISAIPTYGSVEYK